MPPKEMDGMTVLPTWVLWAIIAGYTPLAATIAFLLGVVRTLYTQRTQDSQQARANDLEIQRALIDSQKDNTEASKEAIVELKRLRAAVNKLKLNEVAKP